MKASMKSKLLAVMTLMVLAVCQGTAQNVQTLTSGRFEPYGVAVNLNENSYYFTDSANHLLVRYKADEQPTTTELNIGLSNPQGIAWTTARGGGQNGALVIADTDNHRILIYPLDGSARTSIGSGLRGNSDATPSFNFPYGVAVDTAGVIYVADNQNNSIRRIAADNSVTTLATGFNRPAAIAFGNGRLYVADTLNNSVVVMDLAGNRLQTVAVSSNPRGLLWLGGNTGLLVSQPSAFVIRQILGSSSRVFMGVSGEAGSTDGNSGAARFRSPTGLAVDPEGNILVADLHNNSLRKITRDLVTTPALNFATGSYSNTVVLSITNKITPAAAEFRYTLDESDPTQLSPLMVGKSLVLDRGPQQIVKIRGFSPDASSSLVVSNNYTFFVSNPTFSVDGGSFSNNVSLAINTLTEGATISFTNLLQRTGGVWPGGEQDYGTSGTLIVQATRNGFLTSDPVTNVFGFFVTQPGISPPGSTETNFINAVTLTVTNGTAGTVLRYTLNGTEPTATSPVLTSPFTLATNGTPAGSVLVVKGFKAGYTNSATSAEVFSFKAANPVVTPEGGQFINNQDVMVRTATTGADVVIRFTTDGSVPTETSPIWADGPLSISATHRFRVFKTGFMPSDTVGAPFKFQVQEPVVSVAAGVYTNDVQLSLVGSTLGASYRYTIDGSDPRTSGTAATTAGLIDLTGNAPGAGNARVRIIGTKPGYDNSTEWTGTFTFNAAAPVITGPAGAGPFVNSASATLAGATTGAQIFYTTDGSTPTINTGTLYTAGDTITLTTTNALKAVAMRGGYNDSAVASQSFEIKADAPALSPNSGFFPSGTVVTATKTRADSVLRFTTDGTDPTASSPLVAADGRIAVDALTFPSTDLRVLKVRAFAPGVLPSDVVSGQVSTDNILAIPRDLVAGIGAELVVPVVMNLKQDQVVRSYQFNVQLAPANNTRNTAELSALTFGSRDFAAITDGSVGDSGGSTYLVNSFAIPGPGTVVTQALSIAAVGTNANFNVRNFAAVAMLRVPIPKTAVVGDQFTLRVTNPSATEDGLQKDVGLKAGPVRTVTVADIPYLVGDTSPGPWYNAGDFGDGELDNRDVNNVFYASLQVRVPYQFSDVFDAMDVYPEPEPGLAGGDGQIRFLDYQRVLLMSLRRDRNLFNRTRAADGSRVSIPTTLTGQPNTPAGGLDVLGPVKALAAEADGNQWYREALVSAAGLNRALAGSTAEVPLHIAVLPGKKVTGMEFRASVEPVGDAPPVTAQVVFATDPNLPATRFVQLLPVNEVAGVWDLEAFNPPLTGRQKIGSVRFVVPIGARAGHSYRVRFEVVDGAPDIATPYTFESRPALVWVGADNPTSFQDPITDEWRRHFFGATGAALADAHADPDGDGVPNWKEFLAGTNPVLRNSRLQLEAEKLAAGGKGVGLRWLSAPGKSYVIESTADLVNGPWTVVAEGIAGDGQIQRVIDSQGGAGAGLFYRIRLAD